VTPPAEIEAVLVVIPAHDEEERIVPCLESVLRAAQTARAQCGVETWVVVAADSCLDLTAMAAAAALGQNGATVAGQWMSAGAARRAAADAGLEQLARRGAPLDTIWIANTDADCEVPEGWVVQQLAHARRGADVVLGIVAVDNFDEHPPGVEGIFHHRYVLHGDGSHDHIHGANLGVRADRYVAAGGWPPVALSEDHALARALQSVGATVVPTIDLCVITSGRRLGRARGGFADTLVGLGESA
jgi:glycosyltransferase involved in cell wall biosynthesis